jgi:CYTH domain-containing protein
MAVVRRFLIASSLTRLMRKERGSERVLEGYFAPQGERQSRVRIEKGQAYLVLTSLEGEAASAENWTDVPRSHAEALMEVCPGTLAFERSRLRVSQHEALVDRFMKPGLLDVVSVEFATRSDADAFSPPAWFGAEVTGDDAYTNRMIAHSGLPHAPEAPLTNAALESLLDLIEGGAAEGSGLYHGNGESAAGDDTFDKLRQLAAMRPASALASVPASAQSEDAGQKSEAVTRFRNRRPVLPSRPAQNEDGDARLAGVIQGLSEALAQPNGEKNERYGA